MHPDATTGTQVVLANGGSGEYAPDTVMPSPATAWFTPARARTNATTTRSVHFISLPLSRVVVHSILARLVTLSKEPALWSDAELARRQRSAFDTSADLRERRVACGRRVVAEWREAAIVSGSELVDRDELRCLKGPVADLFRRLHPRIDRIDDADEHPLFGS